MYDYFGYSTTTATSTQYFFDSGFIEMFWYCFLTTWIILAILIMLVGMIFLLQYLKK